MGEEVLIREARHDEADAIHKVLAAAFRCLRGRGYSNQALEAAILPPEEVNRRIVNGDHVLVAEDEGQIAGTATGIEEHDSLHVCSVAVHPDWQGRGIGQRLMKALEDIARRHKCNKLWLQTAWAMTEAIALYEKVGFQVEGYQPRHFYGEDFLLSGKVLSRDIDRDQGTSTLNGAILIYPGVEELDFVGVYEVLCKTRTLALEGELTLEAPPNVSLLAREQLVRCANGLVTQPHRRYAGLAEYEFVVVPGGPGVHNLYNDESLLSDIARFHQLDGVLCSVCTGALVLAWAGVLAGRRATTHHRHQKTLSGFCHVVNQRVVTDERIITAAGVSASLDLGLVLVERFFGRRAAHQVAQRIEYPM